MRISIALAFCLCSLFAGAQNYWFHSLDHGIINERAHQIYVIGDSLYVIGSTGFENDVQPFGGYILVADPETGDVLDRRVYPGLTPFSGSNYYDDELDAFLIIGVNTRINRDVDHISLIDRQTGDLLLSHDSVDLVDHPESVIEIGRSLVKYQNQYIIAGGTEITSGDVCGFITFLHEDFSIDTGIVFLDSIDYVGQLVEDGDGRLLSGIKALTGPFHPSSNVYIGTIHRDSVPVYQHLSFQYWNRNPDVFARALKVYSDDRNDRILYTDGDNFVARTYGVAFICELDEDFRPDTLVEQHQWQYDLDEFRIEDLIVLDNGDLLGVGVAMFEDTFSVLNDEAMIAVRLSPEGDLLWQRMYLNIRTSDQEKIRGGIVSATEGRDGSLYYTGVHLNNSGLEKPFIMKTDVNGCLEEDCTAYNVLSSVERIPSDIADDIRVFPNPTSSSLRISYDFEAYQVYGMAGQVMISGSDYRADQMIEVEGLSSGLYLFVGLDKEGRIWSEQFVVE